MKFLLAIIAYLLIGIVLGWGILLTMKGDPWLLIVSFLVYAFAFGKLGCLPGKTH
jgi:F0F1-type ATP synthase assembly protein I